MITKYIKPILLCLFGISMTIGVYSQEESDDDIFDDGHYESEGYTDVNHYAVGGGYLEDMSESLYENIAELRSLDVQETYALIVRELEDVQGNNIAEVVEKLQGRLLELSVADEIIEFYVPSNNGAFSFEGYAPVNNRPFIEVIARGGGNFTLVVETSFNLDTGGIQNTSTFNHQSITRLVGDASEGLLRNGSASFSLRDGVNNGNGTITYSSIVVSPRNGNAIGGINIEGYTVIENEFDILSLDNSSNNDLPESGDHSIGDILDSEDGNDVEGFNFPFGFALNEIATEAILVTNNSSDMERHILKTEGIVFEDPPFYRFSRTTTLEITASNGLANVSSISPTGYIFAAQHGILGTYELVGTPDPYKEEVNIWLDLDGVSGVDDLEINISRDFQGYLKNEILPPTNETSDEIIAQVVVEESLQPGETIWRPAKITLSNHIGLPINGYGPSGVIFANNGDIRATYRFMNEEINHNGTRTYDEMEITVMEMTYANTPLTFPLYPTISIENRDYNVDLPFEDDIPILIQINNAVIAGNITVELGIQIRSFLDEQEYNEQAVEFANEIMELLINGNQTEKELTREILKALSGDTTFDIKPFLNSNEKPTEIGPASYCEQLNWDPGSNPEILYAYGPGLVRDLTDALWSLFMRGFENFASDAAEGDLIRDVFELRDIPISDDIDNETLGELFQVFSENGEFQVRYEEGIGADLLNVGMDILDVATILSPSRGGGAFLAARGGGAITKQSMKAFLKKLDDIAKTTLAGGRGHKSFNAFKRVEGNASPGNELHHIVEQNGFQRLNQQKFGKTNIHNTKNIIDIPGIVSGSLHRRVTGYYNSIDASIAPGIKVREAIKDWSFQEQYDFGIEVLRRFGWDGVTGIIN